MKKLLFVIAFLVCLASCKNDAPDQNRFKSGTFEIPASKGYEKTIITRIDSLQIEEYEGKIDTLSIHWKNNFNYTLKMLHPSSAIDEEPIHVKITSINENSYQFEAIIGHSNFIQKGEIIKLSN